MTLYEFLKKLQEKTGDGCKIGISLWSMNIGDMNVIFGVIVDILWNIGEENQFSYKTAIPKESVDNEGFLEFYCDYLSEAASRAYRIAEVGED